MLNELLQTDERRAYEVIDQMIDAITEKCQYAMTLHHDGVHDDFLCGHPDFGCTRIEKWISELEESTVMRGGEASDQHA